MLQTYASVRFRSYLRVAAIYPVGFYSLPKKWAEPVADIVQKPKAVLVATLVPLPLPSGQQRE